VHVHYIGRRFVDEPEDITFADHRLEGIEIAARAVVPNCPFHVLDDHRTAVPRLLKVFGQRGDGRDETSRRRIAIIRDVQHVKRHSAQRPNCARQSTHDVFAVEVRPHERLARDGAALEQIALLAHPKDAFHECLRIVRLDVNTAPAGTQ